MGSFFKSLFGGGTDAGEKPEEKEKERKFDVLKYDGIKALKIRKVGYAIRCFNEALNLKEEAETFGISGTCPYTTRRKQRCH